MRAWPILLVPVVFCSGCQLLALFAEDTKEIKAEYPYLANRRVCIVVRADVETLSMYPHVQLEIADHVRIELESRIKGIAVVDPRTVVDFQRSDPGWETMDPADLGQRFGADRVLEIDLTQYTTREPGNEYLYRGHIASSVRIYNAGYPNSQPTYKASVISVFPQHGPSQWGLDERSIRKYTMELFAQEVAGKFVDRKVKA